MSSPFHLPCSNKAPYVIPRKYLVLKTSCTRIENKTLSKIKVGNLGTWSIKNKPQNSVYILIGVLWGILLQIVARFLTPYFRLCKGFSRGFDTINVKGENEQKKVIKNIKSIFSYCNKENAGAQCVCSHKGAIAK